MVVKLTPENNTPGHPSDNHVRGRSNIQTGAKFLAKFLQPYNKGIYPKLGQNFCQNFCKSQSSNGTFQTGAKFLSKFLQPHDTVIYSRLGQNFCQNFCHPSFEWINPSWGNIWGIKVAASLKLPVTSISPAELSSSAELSSPVESFPTSGLPRVTSSHGFPSGALTGPTAHHSNILQ